VHGATYFLIGIIVCKFIIFSCFTVLRIAVV